MLGMDIFDKKSSLTNFKDKLKKKNDFTMRNFNVVKLFVTFKAKNNL